MKLTKIEKEAWVGAFSFALILMIGLLGLVFYFGYEHGTYDAEERQWSIVVNNIRQLEPQYEAMVVALCNNTEVKEKICPVKCFNPWENRTDIVPLEAGR
jgi:hypothetical protein